MDVFDRKDHLFDALEQQAVMVHDAAATLAHLTTEARNESDAEERFARIEENANRITGEVEGLLAHAFTLEIDREDLHGLSTALRSVLVLTMRAVRTALSVVTSGSEQLLKLVGMIVQSSDGIVRAIARLRSYDYAEVGAIARELRTLQRAARKTYDEAVASLLGRSEAVDMQGLLRENLILENLKQIIHGSRELVSLLSYVAVKNS